MKGPAGEGLLPVCRRTILGGSCEVPPPPGYPLVYWQALGSPLEENLSGPATWDHPGCTWAQGVGGRGNSRAGVLPSSPRPFKPVWGIVSKIDRQVQNESHRC